MNTLKIFLLHSFILLIVACGHNPKQATEPNIVLNIDFPQDERHIKLSELVDSISFIRLQTNDSCRIGSIDKLIVAEKFFLISILISSGASCIYENPLSALSSWKDETPISSSAPSIPSISSSASTFLISE